MPDQRFTNTDKVRLDALWDALKEHTPLGQQEISEQPAASDTATEPVTPTGGDATTTEPGASPGEQQRKSRRSYG